ncbi:MAG: FAD-dependent monooxygenase [Cyanobacteria bacterium P01_A01_bin.116]
MVPNSYVFPREPIMLGKTPRQQAIVIGGSIAGMLSAKVLSAYFEEVLIVERDSIPNNAAERKGVPQSPQPHILLTQGYRLLEGFFPGLGNDLLAAGAVPIDWGKDFQYYAFGDWGATHEPGTDLKSFSCTRPLLESCIRQHVDKLSNVKRLSPYRVDALEGSVETVTGVRCHHTQDKHDVRSLQANLVVDASGRSSNALKWLAALGSQVPKSETIDAGLGYATGRYRLPEHWDGGWKVLLIAHAPPDNHQLGYLARMENNELIATLGGYCKQYPPLSQEAFLETAKQLPAPAFYKTIAQATPASKIKAYRSTANKIRHYEALEQQPNGFIAIGDAVCALCPAYGQGLTTSAMSAGILHSWLTKAVEKDKPLAPRVFQKQLAKKIKPAWDVATQSDSGFIDIKNQPKKSPVARLLNGYMNRLIKKSHTNSELTIELTKISHMVDLPIKLFHPKILLKVLS